MSDEKVSFLCALGAVVSICFTAVRGCDRMYNPDTIRADAETRIQLHKAFKE